MLRILDIVEATTVDGPGFRTAVYFAGCGHHCDGCHNPQSWDFDTGIEISVETLARQLLATGLNVTFSGGDPVYQSDEAATLAEKLRGAARTVWLYTGFTFDELLQMPQARRLVNAVDVIVDGPFVLSMRNTNLQFRGSENQRIIDVRQSLASGKTILWESEF